MQTLACFLLHIIIIIIITIIIRSDRRVYLNLSKLIPPMVCHRPPAGDSDVSPLSGISGLSV